MYVCYSTLLHLCRPSDSTVSEDSGNKPRTVMTLAQTARHSNHSSATQLHLIRSLARSHPTQLDLILMRMRVLNQLMQSVQQEHLHQTTGLSAMRQSINQMRVYKKKGDFFMYVIQHCFISAAPQIPLGGRNAGIEPRTVATLALTARHSNHSVRSHPQLGQITSPTWLHLIML